jgi:hypothetical protein
MRIGLTALAIFVMGTSVAQAQECGLKQFESIPMEVTSDQLLLPVSLGGTPKKLAFRMDYATNALSMATVEKMDLRRTSIPPDVVIARDGIAIRYTVRVPELQFGKQSLNSMEFLVATSGSYTDDVVGDLGTHLFQSMDFELDMAGEKFNLFSPDHCPGQTVYWTQSGFIQLPIKPSPDLGYIRVPMTLDGQPLTMALSTGGSSRIGMNAMRRIFNIDETSPGLSPVGRDASGGKLYRYAFKTLTADGLTISNPDILVFDEAPRPGCNDKLHFAFPAHDPVHSTEQARLGRCFGDADAVLGLSVLRKLHLYVSGKEKLLYLTSAEAR